MQSDVVPKLTFKKGPNEGALASASGTTIYVDDILALPKTIAVHETVHAWNFLNGRYKDDEETDEGMAYGIAAIADPLLGLKALRAFERDLDNGVLNTSAAMQAAWSRAWDPTLITSIPGSLVGWV
jgi:hypothetical protein